MAFAIKAEIRDALAETFTFVAQKSMYGGKRIGVGDLVFLFASEKEGGSGLVARGVVFSAEPVARQVGVARQVPRVSVTIQRTGVAKRSLGRRELENFTDWGDERAETEINFKFYRQATNKIIGISDGAAMFLDALF
jgi:hypothetical protein